MSITYRAIVKFNFGLARNRPKLRSNRYKITVLDLIGQLADDGLAILIATHDERVLAAADRVYGVNG